MIYKYKKVLKSSIPNFGQCKIYKQTCIVFNTTSLKNIGVVAFNKDLESADNNSKNDINATKKTTKEKFSSNNGFGSKKSNIRSLNKKYINKKRKKPIKETRSNKDSN